MYFLPVADYVVDFCFPEKAYLHQLKKIRQSIGEKKKEQFTKWAQIAAILPFLVYDIQ